MHRDVTLARNLTIVIVVRLPLAQHHQGPLVIEIAATFVHGGKHRLSMKTQGAVIHIDLMPTTMVLRARA
jgi:hypothetical protein